MRLESTTIPIEPRGLGACLDLAFAFCRCHLRPLSQVTLAFALPAAALAFGVAAAGGSAAWWAAVWFFVAAPFEGAVLVSLAGRTVFGEAPDARTAVAALHGCLRPLVSLLLTTRLLVLLAGLPCFGLSGLLVGAYYGFAPEVVVLERLRGGSARRRLGELMRPAYAALFAKRVVLALFAAVCAIALFTLVDQLCALLLGRPLFTGRLEPRFFAESVEQLLADPWSMALATGSLWLVYPVARLAWFFTYLDARIRTEGWDLELRFRIESQRLEASA